MRSRSPSPDVAEVARRRLEALAAELAAARERRAPPDPAAGPPEQAPGPDARAEPGAVPGAASRPGSVPAREPPADPDQPAEPSVGRPGAGVEDGLDAGRHAGRPLGPLARGSSWARDRLPATVQGRVQLGASHLAVVALVVAAALAATAWWVTRSGPAGTVVPERPVVTAPSAAGPPTSGGTSGATSGATSGSTATGLAGAPSAPPAGTAAGGPGGAGVVVVDVAGRVRRPGIVTLPVGARVVDAVEAAGGPRPGARTTGLNLARVLVDGEQVLVGVPQVPGPAAAAVGGPGATSGAGAGALVNVNTADQATLETLPGVGPVTAQAILAYRSENGPFSSVDELVEVSGIGEATLAEIAPHVTL